MKHLLLLLTGILFIIDTSAQQVPVFKTKGRIGGTGSDYTDLLVADASGNIYVAGRFSGTCDFDPGSGVSNLVATSASSTDGFMAKYSAQGALLWAKPFRGNGAENMRSLKMDGLGHLYLLGDFTQTIDLDPGADSILVTANAGTDMFIVKLNANGDFVHGFIGSGPNTEYSDDLDIDSQGNIYAVGEFNSPSMAVGSSQALYNSVPSGSSYDGYILKLDSTLSPLWSKSLQGPNSEYLRSIVVDAQDRIVVGGNFSGTMVTDSLSGASLTATGTSTDCMLARYASDGSYQNSWSFGGTGTDNLTSLDASGTTIYTTGTFNGSADVAPGPDTTFLQSKGGADLFLISVLDNGTLNWATSIGGAGSEGSRMVRIGNGGDVYLIGDFTDSADFTPNIPDPLIRAYGFRDGFVSKHNVLTGETIWALKIGSSQFDYMRGLAIDSNGEVLIGGYYGNAICYFDPISLANNLPTAGGNDGFFARYGECTYPVVSTNPASTGACPGGNVQYSINATGTTLSYQWQEGINGGITWSDITNGGVYSGATTTTLNLNGVGTAFNNRFYRCIVSESCGLNTTSGVGILFVGTPDTSVNVNGITLSALAVNSTYQWLNCSAGYTPINGATNQSFTPSSNGSYALQITRNGCTDTSACYVISAVGLQELAAGNAVSIFPNPATNQVSVRMKNQGDYLVWVSDLSGRLIVEPARFSSDWNISLVDIEAGTYLVELIDNLGNRGAFKLIRE
jgi:hypothetical protein